MNGEYVRRGTVGVAYVCAAGIATVVAGVLVAERPGLAGGAALAAVSGAVLWRWPAAVGVLVLFVTPLVTGIDRGRLVPMLRPNEALVVAVTGVLVLRAVVRMPLGGFCLPRLTRIEVSLILMAAANSVSPLMFMVLRGREVTGDDISYAMVLWKYIAVYALVRHAVRTQRAVRWCLVASLLSAAGVGLVGFLQALDLLGVRGLLLHYWAPFGYTDALAEARGGSTIGLPAATADLMMLNLVVAVGLWTKDRRSPALLTGAGAICVMGTLAAAEFSSFLGLLVLVLSLAWVLGRLDLLRWAPLGLVVGLAAVWPVVEHRLSGFGLATGLPVSWTTRLYNLRTYFWPELVSGWNPVLGVRPSARVVAEHQGTGFVWIESGYMWLVWGGGLPLVLAFGFFVWVVWKDLIAPARRLATYSDVAALAAFSGVVVIVVLMNFDPHLTYRGSGDCLFALLALAGVSRRCTPEWGSHSSASELHTAGVNS
ncbi:MAG: hypothetical protein ABIQ59_12300 [Nocardioidaceae bacterium]